MTYRETVLLAAEFGREFSRLHNARWYDYPPDVSTPEARGRLSMLAKRIGAHNFRRVAAMWESWLIPGIDK